MDLKLPEIEPARVVPSAAGAIDRAGAQFKQAADSVGQALLEPEIAKLTVETQEATIQRSREESAKLNIIKKRPYVTVDQAKEMFPNGLPAGVKTEEPDGSPRIIPMSELAVHYFDQEAPGVTDRASQQISAPGWRKRFQLAAQEDSDRKRETVLELQRNLQLADNELRAKLQYDQMMDSLDFDKAEAILSSDVTIGEVERTKMRAAHPERKTLTVVLDRLRSDDVKELDSLITDLTVNEVNPKNGIYVPIDAEKRFRLLDMAENARSNLLAGQARAADAAYQAEVQTFFDKIQQADAQAAQSGRQVADFVSVTQIPLHFKREDYNASRDAILAEPARVDDDYTKMGLAEMKKTPGLLGRQPATFIMSLKPKLTQKAWTALTEEWAKDKAEPGSVKPPLPDQYVKYLDDAVDYAFGGADKAKGDPAGALGLKATLYDAVAAELARNPKTAMSDIFAMASRLKNARKPGMFSGGAVPLEADAVVRRHLKARATETSIRADYQKAQGIESDVKTAWEAVMGTDTTSPEFDSGVLMDTYYRVTLNREALSAAARARLDARPATKGAAVDDRQILYQAVLEQAPSYTAEGRAAREREAERIAGNRQMEEQVQKDREAAEAARKKESTSIEDLLAKPPPDLAAEFKVIEHRRAADKDRYSEATYNALVRKDKLAAVDTYRKRKP